MFGINSNPNDPYSDFNGGMLVENFNDFEVSDFNGCDCNDPDSFFKKNKQRQAERKYNKGQKQLDKGHIKAANRKLSKANKIFSGINNAQQKAILANQQMANIANNQNTISSGQTPFQDMPTQPLSQQPMTDAGSNTSGMSSGIGTGIEQMKVPNENDEPTGWLAKEKELENAVVYGKRKKSSNSAAKGTAVLIMIIILIIGFIYAYPQLIKKK